MRRVLTSWKVIGGLLFVSAIFVAALWPQTTKVDVTMPVRGDLAVTIDEEGETRVRDRFVIAAPVAGRLQRIDLEPGDAVKRGGFVARLTPSTPALLDTRTRAELALEVESAQAALGAARAQRERAATTAERNRSLVRRRQTLADTGMISRDQLEADQAAMKASDEDQRAAEFAVMRAEHELEIARARLQQPATRGGAINVVSPIDGMVLKLFRKSESDVPTGEPLLEVGDRAHLEVVTDLLSTDAVQVSAGSRVWIENWGGTSPLEGRVRRVEPKGFLKLSALGVQEQRVDVIIDFESIAALPEQLGDGYRVEVRILLSEHNNVLKIPIGSIFRHGENWAVFTINEGRARLRQVSLGPRNDLETVIVQGLTESELVILHPPEGLSDGMRVTGNLTTQAPAPD